MRTAGNERTLATLIGEQAQERDAATAYRYLAGGELETRAISFRELERAARAVAARVQRSAAFGDRALILAEDPIEFIRAFMGCQLAGVIAVPVSSPFPTQRGRRVETLRAIAGDCGASVVLTGFADDFQSRVEKVAPELARLSWVAVDEVTSDAATEFRPQSVRAADVAFLQYTSGSTSAPRGVVVTHDMVMRNEAYIKHALRFCPDDIMVSWLPLFHDMGLIGVVLPALYSGSQAVLMPPSVFARRPLQWLRTISRYRATIAAAPDSAYRLCVEKIAREERAELDLRSWRLAANGAEPVSRSTLDAFTEAFGPCGFDERSWFVTYGLAECTLMATAPRAGAGARTLRVQSERLREGHVELGGDKSVVGCGAAGMHRRIEIVDPETCHRVDAGEIGEIWIGGPDVARRYWERPGESAIVFGAVLADTGEGPFLRSGDLGFVLDDELYVTGRLKDLIIVSGRNHYPQDIEATAVSVHPALVDGGCAAFSIEGDNGGESVVVVAELQGPRSRLGVDVEQIAGDIHAAVASEHGIAVAEVVLVDRKSVPKTSSGKVQRSACRAALDRGDLPRARSHRADGGLAAHVAPAERRFRLRRVLLEQIETVLRLPPGSVDPTAAFRDLGLDSLKTAELRERLERALGDQVSPTMFFAHPTTDRLVERLLDQMAPTNSACGSAAAPDERDDHALAATLSQEIETVRRAIER